MAHFSPEFIDTVQMRTDLVEVISHSVQLKKSGSGLVGLCPFHHEKSPSFSVSPDKQLYYCFGCGNGGGVFKFLMEHDGYSFPEAVEYLAEKAGLEIPESRPVNDVEVQQSMQAQQFLTKAAEVFARTLHESQGQAARDYLAQRKMPEAVIQHYQLGFAPDGYGFMQRCFGGESFVLESLEAAGLLFKGERGYADRFRGRLIFPIRNRRGKVVGFGGRVLADGEPKYLNSPETALFHKAELLYGLSEHRVHIRKRKWVVVVEGYMDVLALAAHDLPVGLAPLGTAIGEAQIRDLLRLNDAPVFCFDGDRAGKQAAWRALERMLPLLNAEHAPQFLYLPEGSDPDSMVHQEGGAGFEARIREQAMPVMDTWLKGLKLLAGKGAQGRARMAKKADAMLQTMQDDYLKQAWLQEIEKETGIQLKPLLAQQSSRPLKRQEKGGSSEENFVAALIRNPDYLHDLPEDAHHFLLDDAGLHQVYTRALHLSMLGLDVVAAVQQAFPDDVRIARWVNETDVDAQQFEFFLLTIWVAHIERLLSEKQCHLAEKLALAEKRSILEKKKRCVFQKIQQM